MTFFIKRIQFFLKHRLPYLLAPAKSIFPYTDNFISKEKRIVDNMEKIKFSENIILTTYFCTKVDPQRKFYVKSDNFSYISKFYQSIHAKGLAAVIFYDNLSNDFVANYNTENVRFIKCDLKRFSLNDERFFIFQEFLEKVKVQKVIFSDVNDVIFGRDPFHLINDNRFYIGRDKYTINDYSEWMKNKIEILPKSILNNITALLYRMPIVNAGVIGGKADIMLTFAQKVNELLTEANNDWNNNMACVNIAFFDSYWLPYQSNIMNRLRLFTTSQIKELKDMSSIQNDQFLLGKPFTSSYLKYEENKTDYIFHK